MARTQTQWPLKLICAAMAAGFAQHAAALPTDAVVTSGTASFAQTGNVLTVTNSNRAIINWGSFSIGRGETVRFDQAASSSVLNRVVGITVDGRRVIAPSEILGYLQSPGKVFLLNQSGTIIGAGAVIDVAGFVASSLMLSDADFLANRLRFTNVEGAGNVQNFGEIKTTSGGNVYLIAPNVENHGIIQSPNGEVILAAGKSVELLDSGTPGVKVAVSAGGEALNVGQLLAESGRVGMVGAVVRQQGTVSADSVVREGGRIFLKATQTAELTAGSTTSANGTLGGTVQVESSGTTVLSGTVLATGNAGSGGRVELLGDQVSIIDAARVDASGKTGGGTILVGGDYQGKNTAIRNASSTTFGKDAVLTADATDTGDGGKIVVWADGSTSAYGNISARGGAYGGDGGFVEVSGKQQLIYRGLTNTSAARGKTGTLLLDPTSITLIAGAGTDGGTTFYGDNITANLGSSNVIMQTGSGGTGNITFTAGTYNFSSATAANSLKFLAYSDGGSSTGDISLPFGTFITMKVGAPLAMVAGWDGASVTSPAVVTGYGNLSMVGSTINAQGGGATLLAGGDMTFAHSSVSTVGGNMYIKAGGDILLDGTNTAASTLSGSGAQQWVEAGGDLTLLAGDGGSAQIQYYGSGTQTAKGANVFVRANQATTNVSSHQASISSNAAQNVTATAGNIELTAGGYSGLGTNNTAGISASGTQQLTATGAITVNGGTAGGTANSAYISSNGSQTISANSITITAGNAAGNGAKIEAVGAQTVTTTAGDLNIYGSTNAESELASDTSQVMNIAGNVLLQGGAGASAGGAIIGAPTQNISIGGNLTLQAGTGSTLDAYGLAAPAAIGYDGNSDITLNVGGSISLTGQNAVNPALIGSAVGVADIKLLRGTGINLGNYSFLGNWDGSVGGSAELIATGTAIQQLANGNIGVGSLTATANTDIALDGVNKVDAVDLTANGGFVSYHTANTATTVIAASATSNITIVGDAGSSAISLKELETTGAASTVNVTAQKAILDENGSGVANISAVGGNITLVSATGTTVPGELAISADVATAGQVNASVTGGAYASIVVRDVGANQPSLVLLNGSAGTTEGNVAYYRYGDLTLANISLSAKPSVGSVGIGASGDISVPASGELFGSGAADATLSAGGDLLLAGDLQMRADANTIIAGGNLSVASGKSLYSDPGKPMDVVAGSISLNGGTLAAGTDLNVTTPGNIDITGGGLLRGVTGKLTFLANDLNIYQGTVQSALGIDGTLMGGLALGTAGGSTGYMTTTSGIIDLAIGGTGIAMYNGSYINSTDAAQPAGGLIKLFFPGLSAGGSTIDGVASFDGGYKVNGALTTLGSGLEVTYGILTNPVSDAIVAAMNSTSSSGGGTSETSGSLALAGTSAGTSPTPGIDGTQTVGGTEGTFGGTEATTTENASTTGGTQETQNAKKKPAQCSA